MGQPIQVDLPGLAAMGSAVTAASAGFRTAYSRNEADLTSGTVADGWATASAVTRAGEAWRAFSGELAGQVRAFGDGLSQSARELAASDQASAERVSGAGGPR
ncbi:hypothetical protein AB0J83_20275 [Actinoplanes sp. NPDC049596]|uniref:hypothetical protein n=1 Tax=unclassified Actinoplanes TaxID=2626549 RepID=UPI00341D8DBF